MFQRKCPILVCLLSITVVAKNILSLWLVKHVLTYLIGAWSSIRLVIIGDLLSSERFGAVSIPGLILSKSKVRSLDDSRVSNHERSLQERTQGWLGFSVSCHILWFQDLSIPSQDFKFEIGVISSGNGTATTTTKRWLQRGTAMSPTIPYSNCFLFFQNSKSMASPVTSLSTSFYIYRPPIWPPFQVIKNPHVFEPKNWHN